MPVGVSEPVAKRVTQWDEYSGRFEAVDSVEVRARVSGFIDKIDFRDGQIVKVGDPLFTIDKRPYEIAVDVADADVARNKAQVDLAELQVDRGASLIASRTITEAEQDSRKSTLAVARAQLKSAEAALRNAQLNLEWTNVTAPIAGRISDRKVDPGNLIAGGQTGATLLATIVTLDPIHFVFDVSEADHLRYSRLILSGALASSRDGANPVRIRLSDETEWKRTGKIDFVDNAMNARSGTIRVRALVDNKDQFLTPGTFGRLQLFGGEYRRAADSRLGHRLRPGAQDRVRRRPGTTSCGQAGDARADDRRSARDHAPASRPTDKVVLDGLANPDGPAGRQGRRARASRATDCTANAPGKGPIMRFSHFFIDRPIFASVLSVIIMIVGLHRPARPADRGISRDRAADRHHHRDLSRRLRRGRSPRRSPRRSSRRSTASTTCSTSRRSRPVTAACRSTSCSSPASTSTRRRCWCRTASPSPSRACREDVQRARHRQSARPRPT